MIVILEGINGTGKTTVASEINKKIGFPVYRAFKSFSTYEHFDDESEYGWLKDMNVPFNTHVDDLYVSDFVKTVLCDVILDRSMPSAIAYGSVYDGEFYNEKLVQSTLFGNWQNNMLQVKDCLYVWLEGNYETMKERCTGRWHPNKSEYKQLNQKFGYMFQRCKLNKVRISTTTMRVEHTVNTILKRFTNA